MPVDKVDDSIRQLADDMLRTMYAGNGVGLAAEQIGRTEALVVLDTSPADRDENGNPRPENPGVRMPLVMVNPEILETGGEQVGQEGCLSFPEIFVSIRRAAEVTARFQDLDGRERTVRAKGLLARAIQHEIDHLNGVLLVDRMSAVQKVAMAGRLKRLKQLGKAS